MECRKIKFRKVEIILRMERRKIKFQKSETRKIIKDGMSEN